MQIPSRPLKLAALLVLAASATLPSVAQATSTVVYAGGDDLVVKAADGKMLNYTVPAGAKLNAAGKQVTVAELKPGTKLTGPMAGTPQVVTSVSVVKGKVYNITPPNGVSLSLAEGVKEVTVPAGTTFMVDGKKIGVSELKNNMMVEATIVTTAADGTSATDAPAQTGALLVAHAPGSEEDLPAAGTHLPLFAALGAGFLVLGFALLTFRKPVYQA